MSLRSLGLTPDPLVRNVLRFYLCLTILLVVLVFWGLMFLHQQESSPRVIFLCLIFSYQQESSPKVVDSLKQFGAKIPYFFPNLKLSFIVIVIVRICLARSNHCSFNKNMIRCVPMGTTFRISDSGIRDNVTTTLIQCING